MYGICWRLLNYECVTRAAIELLAACRVFTRFISWVRMNFTELCRFIMRTIQNGDLMRFKLDRLLRILLYKISHLLSVQIDV